MIIHLHEVPPEGQSWTLTHKTAELNEALRDLIGNTPFKAEFTILPLTGGTFDLRGEIRTELPESCSRCGQDFQFDIAEKFHELLMPSMGTPRDAKYAKANHYSDQSNDGPSVVEYSGNAFDASEYFHEVVAIAEPLTPAPAEDADGKCSLCKIQVRGRVFNYVEEMPEEVESPFSVLKKIKI